MAELRQSKDMVGETRPAALILSLCPGCGRLFKLDEIEAHLTSEHSIVVRKPEIGPRQS